MWGIFFIGCIFAVLGGFCAFVITLEEMRHHFPTGNRAVRESFQRAVVITVLLAAAAAFLAVMMPRLAGTRTESDPVPSRSDRAVFGHFDTAGG